MLRHLNGLKDDAPAIAATDGAGSRVKAFDLRDRALTWQVAMCWSHRRTCASNFTAKRPWKRCGLPARTKPGTFKANAFAQLLGQAPPDLSYVRHRTELLKVCD